MSKGSILVLVGVLLLVLPISGFPISVENWFVALFGAIVAGIGASIRIKKRMEAPAISVSVNQTVSSVPVDVISETPSTPHISSIA